MSPAARALAVAGAIVLAATACASEPTPPAAGDADLQVQPGATLLATVGTADDPESYEMALTTQDGQPVESISAGQYALVVQDYAQTHNFHLSGGGVDVATDVPGTGEQSFDVTFGPGEYFYRCDPHPSMNGVLQVV